ncbi:type 1 glutamine amidotransferase [Pengzhenrongella sp.]|uniref:type 1 glutamine amidotransferase n=1 Tax=Pengzhenrongella sp. TaxID=2888820 RepID=UPI002F948DC9
MPRLLVVENDPDSGLRRLHPWFEAEGLTVEVRPGLHGLPANLDGYAGLVLLGGGLMPDDDAAAPWLARERVLAREAIDADLPTLGICLGAQLLALVDAGDVRANHGSPERGSTALTCTPAAREDGLFGAVPESFHAIENHRDVIVALPPGATLLASSAACRNQAFRLGSRVWGVQFHPEVDAARLTRWDSAALAAGGFDSDALAATAAANEPDTQRACRELARAFAAQVRGQPTKSTYAGSLSDSTRSTLR